MELDYKSLHISLAIININIRTYVADVERNAVRAENAVFWLVTGRLEIWFGRLVLVSHAL